MLIATPGPHKISLKDNLEEIFILDKKVADASPYILPLETPNALLNFLTKEHPSDTYIWNNEEGNLVGFFSVAEKKHSLEIVNIGVDPTFQGKGFGKQIMSFAEELAKKAGKEKVELVTNIKNLSAVGFYQKIGFVIVKELENYYGDGEIRYLFEKSLI